MEQNSDDTAAWASTEDVSDSAARVDAQVRAVLGRVLAQRRSVEVAFGYVAALSLGTRANCWELAEAAGHEGWGRMQALLRTYAWSWKDLRAELPALAAGWLPDDEGDLIGPGIAIDETAHLKHGDDTACVAPQHAGCTGKVENCVTIVFTAYVTAHGQAWADFDVYMPDRWADDLPRRRDPRRPGVRHQTAARHAPAGRLADADAALDLQGGVIALVALRDAAAKVFPADRRPPADRGLPHGCGSRRAGLGV